MHLPPDLCPLTSDPCTLTSDAYQLKFVVSGPQDLPEIGQLIILLARSVPPATVLLMPEGTTTEILAARRLWPADACKRHGYRFCHRLQLALFGHTRAA